MTNKFAEAIIELIEKILIRDREDLRRLKIEEDIETIRGIIIGTTKQETENLMKTYWNIKQEPFSQRLTKEIEMAREGDSILADEGTGEIRNLTGFIELTEADFE